MVLSDNYELVDMAGEFLAIPVGEMASKSRDVFSFSMSAGALINFLKEPKTEEEMVTFILERYDLDVETARSDVHDFISLVKSYGVIKE